MASSVEIESLEIQVRSDTNTVNNALDKLIGTLGKIRVACQGGAGLNEIATALKSVSASANAITGNVNELSSSIQEMGDVASQTQETFSKESTAISTTGETAKKTERNISKLIARFKEMGTSTKKVTNPITALKDAIVKSNTSLAKLTRSLGRIMIYRAIRKLISEVTKAIKEGTQSVYEYTKAFGGQFAPAVDELKARFMELKNQLGSAFSEVILAITPMIQNVIAKMIEWADTFSQVIAYLRGQPQYLKAVASSWSDASKGASKYKSQLLGIDELNVISKDTGVGGASTTTEKLFDENELSLSDELRKKLDTLKSHFADILNIAKLIGLTLATWKVIDILPLNFSTKIGLLFTLIGGFILLKNVIDSFKNGSTFKNLLGGLAGTLLLAGGLGIVFKSLNAFAVGLAIGGLALLISGLADLIKTGKMSDSALASILTGIALIGVAISIFTGSWIPLAIAGVVALVVAIASRGEEIKAFLSGLFDNISGFFENVYAKISEKIGGFATLLEMIASPIIKKLTIIKGAIMGFVTQVQGVIKGLIEVIDGIINGDGAKVLDGFKNMFKGFVNGVLDMVEGLVNGAINGINSFFAPLRTLGDKALKLFGIDSNIPTIPNIAIPRLKNGGILPSHGQLFIANEGATPEMIGSWGNQTMVSNNEQIINGIQQGVANAISGILAPYLSQIESNTRTTANKDFSVNIGDREIAKANNRGQRMLGKSLVIS